MSGYRDASGRLALGPLLGSGGEGDVYAVADDPARAVKLYRAPDRAREAKVRSMVDAGLAAAHPNVAFPASVVVGGDGAFAGFTMALAKGSPAIHELYSPASRRREFPLADWRFLVRAAINLAHAFGAVHAAGAVVGDVNGSGVLVSRRAVATLIDADSFQWGALHPCRVGVPEFTAPELQGGSVDGVERTIAHDAYGLAVLIFHLLFLGRHPSAGRPVDRDVALPEAIRQQLFPYSRIRRSSLTPPPNTLLLSDLPLGIATLFERAFSGVVERPSTRDWIVELDRLETGLSSCPRNPSHHRPREGACPWCRIDSAAGAPTFARAPAGGGGTASTPAPGQPAFRSDAMRFVSNARRSVGEGVVPAATPSSPATDPATSASPPQPRASDPSSQAIGTAPPVDPKAAVADHAKAARAHQIAIEEWRTRIGAWRADVLVSAVAQEVHRQFEAERRHAHDPFLPIEVLRREAVTTDLRRVAIGSAGIPGVGAAISARLAAAGIANAADVTPTALEAVARIGDRARTLLLLWRDALAVDVERRFRPTPESLARAEEHARLARAATLASDRTALARLVEAAEVAIAEVARLAALPDRALSSAVEGLERARGALVRLGMHPVRPAGRGTAAAAIGMNVGTGGASACPACGGTMVRRWARGGSKRGRYFLGCRRYPVCTGTRPYRRGGP